MLAQPTVKLTQHNRFTLDGSVIACGIARRRTAETVSILRDGRREGGKKKNRCPTMYLWRGWCTKKGFFLLFHANEVTLGTM